MTFSLTHTQRQTERDREVIICYLIVRVFLVIQLKFQFLSFSVSEGVKLVLTCRHLVDVLHTVEKGFTFVFHVFCEFSDNIFKF